jgi:excisionase family DNA binding protein
MEPLLYRVEDAARVLGIGRSKTYQLIASGALPSITVGKSRRIPAESLRRWVSDRLAAASADRRDEPRSDSGQAA